MVTLAKEVPGWFSDEPSNCLGYLYRLPTNICSRYGIFRVTKTGWFWTRANGLVCIFQHHGEHMGKQKMWFSKVFSQEHPPRLSSLWNSIFNPQYFALISLFGKEFSRVPLEHPTSLIHHNSNCWPTSLDQLNLLRLITPSKRKRGFKILDLPSGYVKIAIENGHRNSEFSH